MTKIFNIELPQFDNFSFIDKYEGLMLLTTNSMFESLQNSLPQDDIPATNGIFMHLDKQYFRENSTQTVTGYFAYPPNGGMPWHTNSNLPGIRVYASWSENGNSGMMFADENKNIRIDKDSIGWNIRAFNCPVWHCVWSDCWRVSIGWRLSS
jgi:hypothetical protein